MQSPFGYEEVVNRTPQERAPLNLVMEPHWIHPRRLRPSSSASWGHDVLDPEILPGSLSDPAPSHDRPRFLNNPAGPATEGQRDLSSDVVHTHPFPPPPYGLHHISSPTAPNVAASYTSYADPTSYTSYADRSIDNWLHNTHIPSAGVQGADHPLANLWIQWLAAALQIASNTDDARTLSRSIDFNQSNIVPGPSVHVDDSSHQSQPPAQDVLHGFQANPLPPTYHTNIPLHSPSRSFSPSPSGHRYHPYAENGHPTRQRPSTSFQRYRSSTQYLSHRSLVPPDSISQSAASRHSYMPSSSHAPPDLSPASPYQALMSAVPQDDITEVRRSPAGLKEHFAYWCQWDSASGSACHRLIASDRNTISHHLAHYHHVPSNVTQVSCRWPECNQEMRADSIPRHVQDHAGITWKCSRCNGKLTRGDQIKQHIAKYPSCEGAKGLEVPGVGALPVDVSVRARGSIG
ncbi:hypothetical protein BV22DRAFT_1133374 [Leucogyrophana mollusca]|uniref:Uncharacterized protein n=1 Tax=Leucogyrophana mollusca TaxID=85980 RepID=A0ACB8B2Q1_9AGAM|nr:hypothetical protein BV22DRAFT_1133374 [Leucogyrophana mollusca]